MEELTEEQKAAAAAAQAEAEKEAKAKEAAEKKAAAAAAKKAEEEVKAKKKTYGELMPSDTIVYEVTMQHTVVDEGDVELKPEKMTKSATKAFWEALPKYEKGKKEGQARDINEGLKSPALVGYVEGGKVIKF